MTPEENECEKNKYVFRVTLPSLQEIASNQVILALWRSYISRSRNNVFMDATTRDALIEFGLDENYKLHSDDLVESLKTPRIIEKTLKLCFKKVREQTKEWIYHFRHTLFSNDWKHYSISHFDLNSCVWLPNGEIDYKRTAKKMLSSPYLSIVQKFVIMSHYCMESEFDNYNLYSLPNFFVRQVSFEEDPLFDYWIHGRDRRNDAFDLAAESDDDEHEDEVQDLSNDRVFNVQMAEKCCNYGFTGTAFEYFWDRLGSEDQVSLAAYRIGCTHSHQQQLISKMTWRQQKSLLSRVCDKIILNFWKRLHLPGSALWAWMKSKDFMTRDQFQQLVVLLLWPDVGSEEQEMQIGFLLDMWKSAPDHLKTFIATTKLDDIIELILDMRESVSESLSMKFLLELFRCRNEDSRRTTILEKADVFAIQIADLRVMNELIELCLPNPDDKLLFKNIVMDSDMMASYCEALVNGENFSQLDLKVDFFSSDPNAAREYKKQILQLREFDVRRFILDEEKLD